MTIKHKLRPRLAKLLGRFGDAQVIEGEAISMSRPDAEAIVEVLLEQATMYAVMLRKPRETDDLLDQSDLCTQLYDAMMAAVREAVR